MVEVLSFDEFVSRIETSTFSLSEVPEILSIPTRPVWGFKTCVLTANPDFSRRQLSFDATLHWRAAQPGGPPMVRIAQ
jgi:hypothetical protein